MELILLFISDFIVPTYILIWLLNIYFAGGYEKPSKLWNLSGVSLPVHLLSSLSMRSCLYLSVFHGRFSLLARMDHTGYYPTRLLLMLIFPENPMLDLNHKKRLLIVGPGRRMFAGIESLIQAHVKHEIIGFVNPAPGNRKWQFHWEP